MRILRRDALLLAVIAALLLILAFSSADNAAANSAMLASLQASAIELSISVDPLNIQPGQHATVTVSIKNHSPAPFAPLVQISLPASVSARLGELPAGTIYNAQTDALVWQPDVPGEGAEVKLSLPIVAQVAGAQMPEQKISVVAQAGDEAISHDASFWIGLAPTASIKTNPPQVAVGQPIRLLGTVSGPGPADQLWSLGDGRIVEAENPTVVYPLPGTYEIMFQASTPMGVVSQKGSVVVVGQPIARFGVSDNTPAAGAEVNFVNESGGQQPLSYLWDFGDGAISTEANPTHAYIVPGTFEVRLFVTGNGGQSESIQTMTVGTAPVSDFVIADAVDAGTVIQGQVFADDTVTSIVWDMGDGHQYEGTLVEHVYWSAGDYPVTVTVVNEFGDIRMQRNVRVNPGQLYLYLPLVQLASAAEQQAESSVVTPVEATAPLENATGLEELPELDLPPDLSVPEQLLAYINEARRLNGLNSLNLVPELSAAAQAHADDMALNAFTGHTGSDGTVPAARVQLSGYPGGYAGEATAWGMSRAVEPVRYWLESPGHRLILLDPAARDVGVGFSENYASSSVWYWTAEFASMDLPVIQVPLPASVTPVPEPVLTLLGPPSNGEFALADTNLIFTWSWPVPLSPDQRFAVYLDSQGRTIQIGSVSEPQDGDQYQFTTLANNVPAQPGQQLWFVRLEDTLSGEMQEQSEARPIFFVSLP